MWIIIFTPRPPLLRERGPGEYLRTQFCPYSHQLQVQLYIDLRNGNVSMEHLVAAIRNFLEVTCLNSPHSSVIWLLPMMTYMIGLIMRWVELIMLKKCKKCSKDLGAWGQGNFKPLVSVKGIEKTQYSSPVWVGGDCVHIKAYCYILFPTSKR